MNKIKSMTNEEYIKRIGALYKEYQAEKHKVTPNLNGFIAAFVLLCVFSFVHPAVLVGIPILFFLSIIMRPRGEVRDTIKVFNLRMKKEIIVPFLSRLLPNCEFHEQQHPLEDIKATHLFREDIMSGNFDADGYISYENEKYLLKISELRKVYDTIYYPSILFTFDLKKVTFPFDITIRQKDIHIRFADDFQKFNHIFRKTKAPFLDTRDELFDKKYIMMAPNKDVDIKTTKYLADIANIIQIQLSLNIFLFISIHESKFSVFIFNYPMYRIGLSTNVKNKEYIKFLNLTSSIKTHVDDLIAYLNRTAGED